VRLVESDYGCDLELSWVHRRYKFGSSVVRAPLLAATLVAWIGAKCPSVLHVAALCCLIWVSGCASTLPITERPVSYTVAAGPTSELGGIHERAGISQDLSGAWPLVEPDLALDARIALIEKAQVSVDMQYFSFADDRVGHTVLSTLAGAASRGVRIRLLVDDMSTAGLDGALSEFARRGNVEVRLFNPFLRGRASRIGRLIDLALDFKRLQRRMHNKLFVADGVVAIVGGRNIGDEYFARSGQRDFLDFDLLLTGTVVNDLGSGFDTYWNSPYALPVADVVGSTARSEALVRVGGEIPVSVRRDEFGVWPLRDQLKSKAYRLVPGRATTFADNPVKADARGLVGFEQTLTYRVFGLLGDAKQEVILISPYFIPAQRGLARIRAAREAGVRLRVYTNSLAGTDMPLVSAHLNGYRAELLKMGVELYEIGGAPEKREQSVADLLDSTYGSLHAKVASVDGKLLLIGSLNLDPRSSRINTELGVAVYSEELATMVLEALGLDRLPGTFKLRLDVDGETVRWEPTAGTAPTTEYSHDPNTTWWQRLRLLLMSRLVPEDLL